MTTDYLTLLSDVLTTLESYYPAENQAREFPADLCDVLDRARRALAQPDLVGEAELELFHRYKRLGLIRPDAIFPSALAQPEPEFTAEEVEMIQAPWSYLAPAQPEPVGLDVEELAQLIYERAMVPAARHLKADVPPWTDRGNSIAQDDARDCARAVLQRWGHPAVTPIPVSERLPGPEDCDAHG
jgi:hypothetical protein